jgi:hypothetical protein
MTDQTPGPPESLMRAIAADLKPVKPSPLPLRLALWTAPLALLVSSLILMALGVRRDSVTLGPLLTWGASAAQFALAIVLIWVAAHESTPAARLPRKVVYSVAIIALLVVLVVTVSTFWRSAPIGMRRGSPWVAGLFCGAGSVIAGTMLVLLCVGIFRKSLATRPTAAGALYGAGAGVAVNAGWRLGCPVSTLGHALGAHGGAIIAIALVGAVIGRVLGGQRLARRIRMQY